ncbi:MAG: LCP family protein [Oscillospiraceae bacterium]|nr:LCP family protein [Oscillospiraceae bacterium]
MNKKTKGVLLVLDAILVIGLIVGLLFYQKRAREKEAREISAEDLSRRFAESIRHEGRDFPLNRHLSTVLLIGTDNFVDDSKQNDVEAFYNNNLADFLVILVFDHSRKTVTPFQICRDTMCDVPWLSVNGLVGGTEYEQITFAHTYGSGKEDSCVNTVNAVTDLLYGAPVGNYAAFSMDAVPVLNDLVGGVTVRLEDDIPALGPEYVRGAQVTLKGSAALRFVRYRDIEVLDSNLARMARHRLYLAAFTEAARTALASNEDFAVKAFRAVEPFLCTDLTAENVSDVVNRLCEYEILPAVTPQGEYVMGEPFAEFIVDETSLWDCVRKTFCE